MEKKYKILAAVGAVLFICLVVWVIKTTPTEPPPSEKFNPPSEMSYETNTITEEKNGVKIFELNSEKMIVDATTRNADMEGIKGTFYQEDGKYIVLTAQRGDYNNKTGDVHVEGEVVVVDNEGAKLTSEQLDWKGKKEILTAKGKVKVSKDDMRGYGDSLEATNGLRHFKLKGNARILRGVKNSEDKKQ